MTHTLRACVTYVVRAARGRFAWAVTAIVLGALTESVGLALLPPALQVAGVSLEGEGGVGDYARWVLEGFDTLGVRPGLPLLLGLLVLLVGLRALLGRMQVVAMFAVEQTFVLRLRRRLYHAVANASWLFLCRNRSTDFTHALTEEAPRAGATSYVLLMMAADVILGVLYLGIAVELSWSVTALVLAAGILLMLLHRRRTLALHEGGAELSSAVKLLHAGTIEHLQSLKTAKTYGAVDRNFDLFAVYSRRVADAYTATARLQASAGAWLETGSMIVLFGALLLSAEVLGLPAATILILLLLFARVMPRLMACHQHYGDLVAVLPAFDAMMDLIRSCEGAAEPSGSPGKRPRLDADMRLAGVTFSWWPDAPPVIDEVDLVIPAGKIVALVGPPGAGKSTIADLVMGLLRPDSGRTTIDGDALTSANAHAWRERIGYVSQDTSLFHLSVRDNLLWADPDATAEDIARALRFAAAEEFTSALPQGLDTVVGERGGMISEGERQRLALARAILRQPTLLVLDEATNGLDAEDEARILDALTQRRSNMTVLLIAHRLSTIRCADLVYVIEHGTVVESGTPDELTARPDSRFRALCEAQSVTA